MKIKTITIADASLAAIATSIAEKDEKNFLGDYLAYTVVSKDIGPANRMLERADIIMTIVNHSIESLPQNQKQMLLGWARNKMEDRPTSNERREMLKTGFLLSAAVYGATATDIAKAINDNDVKNLTTAAVGGTAVGAAHLRGKLVAAQCEAVFREKLPAWLKKEYDMDFSWPAEKAKAVR